METRKHESLLNAQFLITCVWKVAVHLGTSRAAESVCE